MKRLKNKIISQIEQFGDGETQFHTRDIEALLNHIDKLEKKNKHYNVINYLGSQDKGINYNRIEENKIQKEYNWDNPEKSFHLEWRENNAKGLSSLLNNAPMRIQVKVTSKTRLIAATIIQWLGSNIGMAFLRSALEREGYQITKIEK